MYNSLHIQACSANIPIHLRGHTHRRKYTFTQRSNVWRRQWSWFVWFTASQLPVSQLSNYRAFWCHADVCSQHRKGSADVNHADQSESTSASKHRRTDSLHNVSKGQEGHPRWEDEVRVVEWIFVPMCNSVWWRGKSIPLNQQVKGLHEICVKLGRTFPDE